MWVACTVCALCRKPQAPSLSVVLSVRSGACVCARQRTGRGGVWGLGRCRGADVRDAGLGAEVQNGAMKKEEQKRADKVFVDFLLPFEK